MKLFSYQIIFAAVTLLLISCGTHNSRIKFQRASNSEAPIAVSPSLDVEELQIPTATVEREKKYCKKLIVQKDKRRKIKEKSFKAGFRTKIITNNDVEIRGKVDFVGNDTLSMTSKKSGTQYVALSEVQSFSRTSVTSCVIGGILEGIVLFLSGAVGVFGILVSFMFFGIFGVPLLVLFYLRKRYRKTKWSMRIE